MLAPPFQQTYAYADEHSAPFSWRTRSTQNLASVFDFGSVPTAAERPESLASAATTEDDLNENLNGDVGELTLLSGAPSKILNTSRNFARQSRGNPSFAKPVQVRTCYGSITLVAE